VEHYARRRDESWKKTVVEGIDKQLKLQNLGVLIAIRELYAGIEFAPPES
jgi:hypothetical protein